MISITYVVIGVVILLVLLLIRPGGGYNDVQKNSKLTKILSDYSGLAPGTEIVYVNSPAPPPIDIQKTRTEKKILLDINNA
jgi:hypothetical protein